MKKILYSLFCLPLFLTAQTQALQSSTTNTFAVSKDTVLESEQWVQCQNATIAGHLKNDLFIFANQKLVLSGSVDGAIWGIGTQVQFSGIAGQNTRLGGETVRVSGILNGSLFTVADTVQISTNAQVHGELNIFGKKVFVEGIIDGPASIQAGELVTLTGTIKGDVYITAPKIIIQKQTRIEGNLTYISGNELILDQEVVQGKLTREFAPTLSSRYLFTLLSIGFLSALITGIFLISIFPVTFALSTQIVRAAPWRCLWIGALVILLLFMLASMTINSFIGLPLGLFLFAGWGFFVYTSQIVVALVLGTLLFRRQNHSLKHVFISLVTGLFLLYLLPYIPGLAPLVFIATTSIGTGALFLTILQQRRLVVQLSDELQSRIPEMDSNKKEMEEK